MMLLFFPVRIPRGVIHKPLPRLQLRAAQICLAEHVLLQPFREVRQENVHDIATCIRKSLPAVELVEIPELEDGPRVFCDDKDLAANL